MYLSLSIFRNWVVRHGVMKGKSRDRKVSRKNGVSGYCVRRDFSKRRASRLATLRFAATAFFFLPFNGHWSPETPSTFRSRVMYLSGEK